MTTNPQSKTTKYIYTYIIIYSLHKVGEHVDDRNSGPSLTQSHGVGGLLYLVKNAPPPMGQWHNGYYKTIT